ncbi:MAG: hypothetical protein ACXWOA_08760, partial [Isosphaeraceae bacterium]
HPRVDDCAGAWKRRLLHEAPERRAPKKSPPALGARWFPLQATMDLLFRPLWTGTPASQDRPQRLAVGYHDGATQMDRGR